MSNCSQCGADLTGIKVSTWVGKTDGKQKKAVWCPNKHPNYINEPKPGGKEAVKTINEAQLILAKLDETISLVNKAISLISGQK